MHKANDVVHSLMELTKPLKQHMYNIQKYFGHFHRICKQFFATQTDKEGKFQFYPQPLHISDLQIIALSCTVSSPFVVRFDS